MGRQRNKPQIKEQEKSPEEINEMEASNSPGIELKNMVIRMLKKFSENFKELSEKFNSMREDIETIKKEPVRNKEYNI